MDPISIPERAQDVNYLQKLFPTLDQCILRDVLHQSNGSVDTAANALLDMAPSVNPRSMVNQVGHTSDGTKASPYKCAIGI